MYDVEMIQMLNLIHAENQYIFEILRAGLLSNDVKDTIKFKAEIGNSQVDLFNPKDYQYVKELKNNNPNIVRCIPLDDINSFSLTEKPTDDMCKILDENGFVINGIDRYGNDFYIRKELLQ